MSQDTSLLSLAVAASAGALLMYYIDSNDGTRRRTRAADKVVASGRPQTARKHATDRIEREQGIAHGAEQPLEPSTAVAHDSWNEQGV